MARLGSWIEYVGPADAWVDPSGANPRALITHGREDALMHWCMTHQIKARELNLVGYEDD